MKHEIKTLRDFFSHKNSNLYFILPAKGAPPSTPTSGSYEEKKALEEKTAQLRALLQCHETKVSICLCVISIQVTF
jgi:hypothetical protein